MINIKKIALLSLFVFLGLYANSQSLSLEAQAKFNLNWLNSNGLKSWIPGYHVQLAAIREHNWFDYGLGAFYELRGFSSRSSFTDLEPLSSDYWHFVGLSAVFNTHIGPHYKAGLGLEPAWLVSARNPVGSYTDEINRRFDLSATLSFQRSLGERSAIQLSYRFSSLLAPKQVFTDANGQKIEGLLSSQGLRIGYIYRLHG
ncbi:MAG TPA: hypothetical protein PKA00_09955 [Saprospiraceae bacterium]|nr:hypothetical protein [Saprospiraceae bacterium]HMQ83221.1 hypothetical protein [Saprospiraceae bacterium]